jgi:starch synthase
MPMHVLMVASEVAPLAKTGGLADVAGSLPQALRRLGCEVSVVMPAHRAALGAVAVEPAGIAFDVPVGQRSSRVEMLRSLLPGGVPVFLVSHECFDRPGLYGEDDDYPDNAERFILFCRSAVELAARLETRVDLFHCHDWQAGLVPAYLRTLYANWPAVEGARSLQTIHNMGYQGTFWHWDMLLTGLDWQYFNWQQMEFHGQLSFLKTGIVFADAVSTVSPTYAREILESPGGCGLEGVLASRPDGVTGIVNGIDTSIWNPRTDRLIPRPYSEQDFHEGKYAAKVALAARLGRAAPDPRPLVAFVGRLAAQKGVELIVELMGRVASTGRCRFFLLGTGDAGLVESLRRLAAAFPEAVDLVIGFDDALAHLAFAAADLTLVPSLYEPCGLTQLYSLAYGAMPVVRATGGLVDTVVDATDDTLRLGTATGFSFGPFDSFALEQALDRGLDAFADRDRHAAIVRQGMRQDWSWEHSGRDTLALYERLVRPA